MWVSMEGHSAGSPITTNTGEIVDMIVASELERQVRWSGTSPAQSSAVRSCGEVRASCKQRTIQQCSLP